ncbi:MAG: DUF2130 domain-containing protein [Phycisphaerales bacterium]
MNPNTIACPQCHTKIEITKAMTAQIADRVRREVEAEVEARKEVVEQEAQKVIADRAALAKAEAELDQRVKDEVEAGITERRAAIVAQARKQAQSDAAIELAEKAERVTELEGKLKDSKQVELKLRKRERELEEKSDSLELDVARRVKEETDRVRAAAKKQADEEHLLKHKETQEQNAALLAKVQDLTRKLEQGSQQAQGEALELVLEDVLGSAFPLDEIEEIAKGVNGGDWLQHVTEPNGLECGRILWETKNAKKWSSAWLPKLRGDQRGAKAEIAVLVTEAMPPDTQHLAEIDGVWVCTRACAATLGAALRAGLVELAKARQAAEGKHDKIERVYDYLSGTEFRQRIAGTVEPLVQMQAGLNSERRAMARIWAAREKQIEAAILGLQGMYGDLQGIVGSTTLPTLDQMDLPQLESATPDNGHVSG